MQEIDLIQFKEGDKVIITQGIYKGWTGTYKAECKKLPDSAWVTIASPDGKKSFNKIMIERDSFSILVENAMVSIQPKEPTYEEFIEAKTKLHTISGFDVNPEKLNKNLFPFQKHIVINALKAGRYGVFADCGLGKTLMQLAWARAVVDFTGMDVLILCPLAVAGQTIQEGEKFGIAVNKYVDWLPSPENDNEKPGIYIANYEQLANLHIEWINILGGIILDESSILKNFEGATRNQIIDLFANTPYKLACTATPSPNDPMELGNHSEFLNVMSRSQMLAMYFVHDGGDTSKWRIKGHAYRKFWQWVSSWSVMLSLPSDIGFSNEGYNLPPLNIVENKIITPKRDNGMLFNDVVVSATNFNAELKLTLLPRTDSVAEIVNNSTETFLIWIKHNEEGEVLRKLIPDAIEVKGSDSTEYKESKLLGFARGEFRVLITKVKIASFGLNYQNCHNQIFASFDFSFEGLYQAIRRSHRFGQLFGVNIYLTTTDTMGNVMASIRSKQAQFEQMQSEMRQSINAFQITATKPVNSLKEVRNDKYTFKNGDCVKLIKQVPDESVHFSIFSPPFADLYTYSDSVADMGNSKDYKEFVIHFQYLIKDLHRVMMSGRNVAVHCMDLPIQKGREGYIGLRDFSGMIIQLFQESGFIYHDRITIWKCPVVEMTRTKALGLLHKQLKKDSSMSRTGIPDYLLVFRKEGVNPEPIANVGIPVELWQKYASPVWNDINYSNTLQFRTAREEADEKHICPLQLETIERAVHLWSNPGDTVLSPFGGIGSEGYQAVKMGRKFIGFELKQSYFQLGCKNLKNATLEDAQLLMPVLQRA